MIYRAAGGETPMREQMRTVALKSEAAARCAKTKIARERARGRGDAVA